LSHPLFFRNSPPDFLLEYFIAGAGAPESLKLAVNRATRSVNPDVLAARARAVLEVDASAEIRQVKVPMLYMQAAEDRLVSSECLDEIERLHPETIAVSISSQHLMLQRQPQAAAKAIVQFMDSQCRSEDSNGGS
jgi:pimeloyl-[acyl-carrier protein] methyl ester esterase